MLATKSWKNNSNRNQIKKTISQGKIYKYKSSTDRSKDDFCNQQSIDLYHKKIDIEKEIEKVNSSILQLNNKYELKTKILKHIKDELNNLLDKKNK